ncbi:MAG: hypothetical protein M1838_003256 [Thelocarpon superellum]|nr:MAG: hypothetical protein M1838_003256 [Thelocarpon superellum]
MVTSLLLPPAQQSPAEALQHSQQAPLVLQGSKTTLPSIPFLSNLLDAESAERWKVYQNLFLSCIRTRDDRSARLCLEQLRDRFGPSNAHVMALEGMFEEAVAQDDAALRNVLADYESTLAEDPTNMPIAKRRVALLRSMSRTSDAIGALVELLDASPTDAESWSELSDLYFTEGLYPQAIFSLEEVLLIMPNAWNIHARMGEIVYASAPVGAGSEGDLERKAVEAMRWFCRSIELCDDFLRGYYGLKLTTGRLLSMPQSTGKSAAASDAVAPPSRIEVEKLNQVATAKLAEIIRRASTAEAGWTGYAQSELIAARELLDRDAQAIVR